jgi:hypothetical protein
MNLLSQANLQRRITSISLSLIVSSHCYFSDGSGFITPHGLKEKLHRTKTVGVAFVCLYLSWKEAGIAGTQFLPNPSQFLI